MAKKRLRRFWLTAHLYLGLSVGVVFALTGLTGSLLAFYVEIDRVLNPALVITPASHPAQSYQAVVDTLHAFQPQRHHGWRLEFPTAPDRPVMARYTKPEEKTGLNFAPLMVAVDPYTLKIINSRFWGETAMTWIYDLHYTLLLDKPGKIVMGVVGILLLFSVGAGIYLWWPKGGRWRRALALRLRHGTARTVYDLHALTGIYGGLLLLILLVTGVVLELPQWINPLVNRASPTFQTPDVASDPMGGIETITADRALSIAHQHFPQAQPRWLDTPDGEEGVYMVRMQQAGEPGHRFPKTMVWIDQYSGEILAVRNPMHNTNGDVFLDWQHPLHSGEAFGLTGRWIIFFSGLMPALLLTTGWIRWRQKARARQTHPLPR